MRTCYGLALACLLAVGTPGAAQDAGEGLVMFPDTLDFGGIPLGGNYFGQFVYFGNETGGPIEIDSPYIGGQPGNPFAWFSNFIGRFTIGDSFSLHYGVRFRPPWSGLFEDDLCVPVTGLPNPCIHLRGHGIEPLSAEVFLGQTAALTTYLPNPGYRPLDVRIRTGQPWATPLPSFAVIPPGDSLEVTIALNATELASGTYRDSLHVEAVGVYFDYAVPFDVVVGGIVAEEDGARPASFEVGDAYPNPTGGAAAIPLSLSVPATVSIEGYDAQGHRVLDLGARTYAAGRHVLTVDASRWAAGSYYIRALVQPDAGDGVAVVRRITVIR